MKKLVLAVALAALSMLPANAQISDIDLGQAMNACSQHQSSQTKGGELLGKDASGAPKFAPDTPAPYAAGWEHCEKLRAEFMKRRADPTASPDHDATKAAASKLR